MMKHFNYRVNATSLPEAEDLFEELEEAQVEIERIKDEITSVFNASEARKMLNGFITAGQSDLTIQWHDASATVTIKIPTES